MAPISLWLVLSNTGWWQYGIASLWASLVGFCIGVTGIGHIGLLPGVLVCLPNLPATPALGTTFLALYPMTLAACVAVRELIENWWWPGPISAVSLVFGVSLQFVLSKMGEGGNLVVIVLFGILAFVGGTSALVDVWKDNRKNRKRGGNKGEKGGGNKNENEKKKEIAGKAPPQLEGVVPGDVVIEDAEKNAAAADPVIISVDTAELADEKPADSNATAAQTTSKVVSNSKDSASTNSSQHPTAPVKKPEIKKRAPKPPSVRFPSPTPLEYCVLVVLGLIIGLNGGPVILLPAMLYLFPRLAKRRLRMMGIGTEGYEDCEQCGDLLGTDSGSESRSVEKSLGAEKGASGSKGDSGSPPISPGVKSNTSINSTASNGRSRKLCLTAAVQRDLVDVVEALRAKANTKEPDNATEDTTGPEITAEVLLVLKNHGLRPPTANDMEFLVYIIWVCSTPEALAFVKKNSNSHNGGNGEQHELSSSKNTSSSSEAGNNSFVKPTTLSPYLPYIVEIGLWPTITMVSFSRPASLFAVSGHVIGGLIFNGVILGLAALLMVFTITGCLLGIGISKKLSNAKLKIFVGCALLMVGLTVVVQLATS